MDYSAQATPRKRSAEHFDVATPTTARKRKAGLPTPNPPLAPFPTPRSTRRRKIDRGVVDSTVDVSDTPTSAIESFVGTPAPGPSISTASCSTPRRALPHHLQTILSLHHAFNVVLSLHIATKPPVLPPHPASTTVLQLPNLTNLLAIRDAVERTAGRRFGQQELARLAWLWTWDGETLPAESSTKRKNDDDNPFLVNKSSVPTTNDTQVSGLSYVVTTTRTLCPKTGRKVHTHGVGIELELEPGETRQVLMGGGEGGIGNQGVGGGVRVIGRWSAGGEMREDTVRQRLERWVELNGGDMDETPKASTNASETCHLPTPTTRESERSEIPPIPLLPLPKLPSSIMAGSPSARLFSAASSSSSSGAPLPPAFATPKKTTIPGLSDPFEFVEKKLPTTPKGSIEDRRRAMEERIKARSQSAKAVRTTLAGALDSPGVIHRASTAEQQEELRRRSTLSRLEGIAEGVWMMFSGPASLSAPRGRRKAIPLLEVADMIVKSSKTPISNAEAQTSLKLLTELCPFFLTCKLVGKHDWLEMTSTVLAPPSPKPVPASPQSSPSRKLLAEPSLTGPASPGRVRRGGLQQVRERIRRELGEF